jgi:hypothetical protein
MIGPSIVIHMSYFFINPLILSKFAKYLRWISRQKILCLKVYEQKAILINAERTDGAESYTGFRMMGFTNFFPCCRCS